MDFSEINIKAELKKKHVSISLQEFSNISILAYYVIILWLMITYIYILFFCINSFIVILFAL